MIDNYPEDHELDRIKAWPIATRADYVALMEYCMALWMWDNYATRRGSHYRFATGGWSGNESIIEALQGNMMFWMSCWRSSHIGGLYKFRIPKK